MRNVLVLLAVLALGVLYLQPGHWLMIGALLVMVTVHELGHWAVARWYGMKTPVFSIGMGSSPRIVLFKAWDTEFQITPWLLGGYVQIDLADEDFLNRPVRQRFAVMIAGIVMNVVLAVGVLFAAFATMGQPAAKYDGAYIRDFAPGAVIARNAGFQPGDEFVSVDGKPVGEPADLQKSLAAHSNGTAADVLVNRGGKPVHVKVTPDAAGHIGIMLGAKVRKYFEPMGVGQAFTRSISVSYDMSTKLVYGVGALLHIVPMPANVPAGGDEIHGIVAIVQIGNEALAGGVFSFLFMVALISMNFAVMNILPVPVLDGGHIAFLAWEKVTGKRVPMRIQGALSMVFMALLMSLMVYGVFNDIVHPISMFKK